MIFPKIQNLWKLVSYEPVMLLFFTSLSLSLLSAQNLLLKKACYPGDSLPELSGACPDEVKSQKIVTDIQSWQNLVIFSGPVLFILFAGPWSDSHGKHRKPLMLLPICGQLLSDLLCLLNVFFWSWSPTVAALLQSLPLVLTGWRPCFVIGVISYIADTSSLESRTVRTGVFSALYFLGNPIAAGLFGLLFFRIGFYGVFSLSVLLNVTGIVYLVLILPDSDPQKLKETKLKLWEGLFDLRQPLESFKTVCKPRKGSQKTMLLLIIFVAPLTLAPLLGEFPIFLLFVRYQFKWNEVDYGFYTVYKSLVVVCGTLITTRLFSRILGLSDAVIGMMASVSMVVASIGYTLATASWVLFMIPVVDFMQGAAMAVVYASVSKIVEDTEIAQVNGMIALADGLYPLINLPLYNQVYNRTFTHLAGAVFLLSAVYGAITLVVFGVMYYLQRSQRMSEKKIEKPYV